MNETPKRAHEIVPYREADIADRFWKPEPWDGMLTIPGFISDFLLMTRGVETPTKLSLWTAVWVLSSMLKREAYLQWYPDPLFPNFFVLLVGPPKIVAKSTAVRFGEKILSHFHDYIDDEVWQKTKEVNLLRSKATPEAMSVALAPKRIPVIGPDGTAQAVDRGSQLTVVVSELSTFLGKQKYQSGLIDRLTDLYDSKDEDDELTIGRGYNKFYNIYFTLIGATTPKHLEESVPEEAFGGGFMSRVVIAYQHDSTRDYPEPRQVIGGPSIVEMQQRCAWIACNAIGEYQLDSEAKAYYYAWYMQYKERLKKYGDTGPMRLQHRFDLHLLKLALILRAQEYRPGRVIELQHLRNSESLLNATYEDAHKSIENVGVPTHTTFVNRVKNVLMKKGRATRRQLLTATSPYGCTAEQLTKIIDHLNQSGTLDIILEGKIRDRPSTKGVELYVLKKGLNHD